MHCSKPGFPVLHHLPEFAQTHVHWVGDAIQAFHLLLPLLLLPSIFPSIRVFSISFFFIFIFYRVFSNELAVCIRWPRYWSFSFSISPSNNIQGWFPLGLTGFISLLPTEFFLTLQTLHDVNSVSFSYVWICADAFKIDGLFCLSWVGLRLLSWFICSCSSVFWQCL